MVISQTWPTDNDLVVDKKNTRTMKVCPAGFSLHFSKNESRSFAAWWRQINRLRRHFLAGVFFIGFGFSALAQEYQVEGDFTYEAFNKNGVLEAHFENTFKIIVSGCKWSISAQPAVITDLEPISLSESRTDGTNVYKINTFNPIYDREKGLAAVISKHHLDTNSMVAKGTAAQKNRMKILVDTSPKTSINNAVGEIYSGTLPRFGSDFLAPLWLAYASSCFFENTKTNEAPRMAQFDFPRQAKDDYMVKADWQLSAEAPHLPTRVALLNNGTHYVIQGRDSIKLTPYLPPYNTLFTNVLYEMLAQTNAGGLSFPATFRLSHFVPISNGTGSSQLKTTSVIEGHTRRISLESLAVTTPSVSTNTIIQDMRFKLELASSRAVTQRTVLRQSMNYLVKPNSTLGGTNINQLTQLDRERWAEGKRRQNKIKLVSNLALGILILGFTIVAVVVIKKGKNKAV